MPEALATIATSKKLIFAFTNFDARLIDTFEFSLVIHVY